MASVSARAVMKMTGTSAVWASSFRHQSHLEIVGRVQLALHIVNDALLGTFDFLSKSADFEVGVRAGEDLLVLEGFEDVIHSP